MPAEPLSTAALSELAAPRASAWNERWTELLSSALAARYLPMIVTVATSMTVAALNAMQGVLLARLLGPAGRGEYGTAVFYTQTLTYIGLFGSVYVLARRAAQSRGQFGPLRNTALRYSLLTGLATAALVALVASLLLPAEKQFLLPLCVACAGLLPFEHLRLMLLAIDQGSARFARFNLGQFVNAATLPGLLVLAWLCSGGLSLTWIVGLTIVAPLAGVSLGAAARQPRLGWSPAAPSAAVLVREGRPYWLAVIAGDLFNRLDMFLVLWLATLSVQGNYAAAVPAAGLLCIAPNALALFAFNAGAKAGRNIPLQRMLMLGAAIIAFQAASALALAWGLQPLMLLVYGNRFEAAVPLALALLPAHALYGCTQIAEGYLRGRNRNGMLVGSRVLAAIAMTIAIDCFWATRHEMAIPLAVLAGQFTIFVCIAATVLADRAAAGRDA